MALAMVSEQRHCGIDRSSSSALTCEYGRHTRHPRARMTTSAQWYWPVGGTAGSRRLKRKEADLDDCDPVDPDDNRQGGSGLSRRDLVFIAIPAAFSAVNVWHEMKMLKIYEQGLAQLSTLNAAPKRESANLSDDPKPNAGKKKRCLTRLSAFQLKHAKHPNRLRKSPTT